MSSRTSSSSSCRDAPPSLTAAAAASASSFALAATWAHRPRPFPFPLRTASSSTRATSSAAGASWSPPQLTGTAAPASSTSSRAFTNWSAVIGHASIGTPAAQASSTEFHPQCVTNHPTALCRSAATCGAHPRITRPLPPAAAATRSSNPSGSITVGPVAHTNATPLRSSAVASAAACGGCSIAMLPKLMYTTEPSSGNLSSHVHRSAAATAVSPPRFAAASASGANGPTARTRLNPRSTSVRSSSRRNVLDTNAELPRFQRKFRLTPSETSSPSLSIRYSIDSCRHGYAGAPGMSGNGTRLSSSSSSSRRGIRRNNEWSTAVPYTADGEKANRGTPSSAASGCVHPQKKSESTATTRSGPSDRSRAQSRSGPRSPE
nr:unnamed protein product [Digitaria exilis]